MKSVRAVAVLGATIVSCGAAVLMSSSAQAVTHIGTLYEHENYSGSTSTVFATPNGFECSISTTFGEIEQDNLDNGSGWNDVISSFNGYSGCRAMLFENAGYVGASYGYSPGTSYVGDAMNDQTSSISWS